MTDVDFPIDEGPRRPGDPAVLVADSRRLKALLGWTPRHDDLDYIVATAWRWEQRLQARRARRPGCLTPVPTIAGAADVT